MEYEDYWNDELSEVEEMAQELTDLIKSNATEEIKRKISSLESENETLKKYRDERNEFISEYNKKNIELQKKENNLYKELKEQRIKDLMPEIFSMAWVALPEEHKREKCDKCNHRRETETRTPKGKIIYEDCKCKDPLYVYIPKKAETIQVREIETNKDGYKLVFYYRPKDSYRTEMYNKGREYKGEPFSEYENMDNLYFKDKETCQNFCDYKNNMEE